ncbi:MAG: tRNA (cytidine(34)-2'-O)-methyltransferase [Deltaproteobacteria bacterium]|nr:tRNA (cytidine(34)-2'-O)-methyltransferase [Deltaproteobacteria bacterium]MBN2672128.1 tRNA (cytidine(34)-2'-O)-methyltransferase [Deltaproteobacteria bacterium]
MAPTEPVHIVLVNPEIPQNTGNIARLCAATGAHLHLVGNIGFSLDEKAVRRAGLDYWHLVTVCTHTTFSDCLHHIGTERPILFSSKANKSFLEAPYTSGCTLVFGAESVGLPDDIVCRYPDDQYGIPTLSKSVRSLNLANSVSIALYKTLEVTGALNSFMLSP